MLEQGWKFLVVQGVVAIVFGIIAMIWPLGTALTLVVVWGIFALVDGITEIIGAFSADGGGRKTLLVVMGIISILAGLYAVTQPIYTSVAIVWVLGVWLIVRAGFEAYAAFTEETGGMRWLRVLGAVFYLIAGIILVSRPAASALGLALWLGIFALAAGVSFVVAGLMARSAANRAGSVDSSAPAPA